MENHIQGCTMNETLAVKWLLLVYLYCYLFHHSSFLSEGLGLLLESFLADAPATNRRSLRPSEIFESLLPLKEIFTATRMWGGRSFSPALENCAASSWAPQCQSGTLLSPEVALPCRQHTICLWLLKRPFLCLYFHKFSSTVSWLVWISLGSSCVAFAQHLESAGLCLSCGLCLRVLIRNLYVAKYFYFDDVHFVSF